ncbi:ABC transporter permease [Marinibaculum pumilum]|uniref:ABC transporter permease n=1 Tax=Marinibaculum pumilum TaxID=1766165 RepID=A0ABV7L384_9PROT
MRPTFTALDRKLVRDLWRIRGQALAIALVIGSGIALYVMSAGMLAALSDTRAAYYEQYRFADIFAPTVRAPRRTLAQIADLPGVTAVAGRVAAQVLVDLPEEAAPVSGRAVSLPAGGNGAGAANRIHLVSGRLPEAGAADEALLLAPFAEARGLGPGDRLQVTMNGRRRALAITGTALSPEHVYSIPPGELTPDDRRFAVVWLDGDSLAAAFDLDGAYNEALVTLSPGASAPATIAGIDRILAPYGGTGAYPRSDHVSDRFLTEDLKQLHMMGRVLPPIFLAVAAFLLNIVVSRLIESERQEIGLMKAFGYGDRQVAGHYARFVAAIVLAGGLFGCATGNWLGAEIARVYQQFYHFPYLIFRPPPAAMAVAVAAALAAAALGVVLAVRRAVRLTPAEAMRPPAPQVYARAAGGLRRLEGLLDQPSRMVLRRLARQPLRAGLTCFGIAAAMALTVTMNFNRDAVAAMIDISFHVAERADVTVTFREPRGPDAALALRQMDGVMAAEPVREVAVRLVGGRSSRLGSITGLGPQPRLSRALTADLAPVAMPERGIVLSRALAELLGLSAGEQVLVEVREGRRPTLSVPIAGIADTLIGTGAYMDLERLNRLAGEGPRISAVHLSVDPAQIEALAAGLKEMPQVAGVSIRADAKAAFRRMVDEGSGVFRWTMTLFAALIAIGVVYNAARIALAERARDLASLRVLGLTRGEAGYILLGELAVLTLLALPLGAVLGYGLSLFIADAFSTDLYRIPVVIAPDGYGNAALVVLGAALVSGWLVQRDVARLDLVAVLKTRE